MPTVRTTIQPHVELEVDDTEYINLKQQGLLIEDLAPAPSAAAAAPAKSPASAKAKDA